MFVSACVCSCVIFLSFCIFRQNAAHFYGKSFRRESMHIYAAALCYTTKQECQQHHSNTHTHAHTREQQAIGVLTKTSSQQTTCYIIIPPNVSIQTCAEHETHEKKMIILLFSNVIHSHTGTISIVHTTQHIIIIMVSKRCKAYASLLERVLSSWKA